MTPDLILKYEQQRVPRYTSYPTAPLFTADVTAGTVAGWLDGVDHAHAASLYLHVPFCETLCWYCGCHTKATRQYAPVAEYVESLLAEIDLVAARVGRLAVRHLHWGGGTPTILSAADIRRITERLTARFDIAADAEIAVEIDPRVVTDETIAALVACGVNRASIGVQSFEDKVQQAINRRQSAEVTASIIGKLRDAGIANINLDLVYGLPHETVETVERTVTTCLGFAPDRLAVFGYAHLPSLLPHQRVIADETLPGGVERIRQFLSIARLLDAAGYVAIGLDHFARPGDTLARAFAERGLRRNFQGYTADPCDMLIGFGASAISSLPQGYAQNTVAVKAYREAVAAGCLPVARGVALTQEDRARRDAIEQVMCFAHVDPSAVARHHGLPPDALRPDASALATLTADGIVTADDAGRLSVTEACRPLLRSVAALFDAYWQPQGGRHARAV